ncbi:MAG: hypothetical protein AAFY56_16135 [Pseudomonadota bacterium]
MDKLTEEETERLNKILSLEVNPYLYDGDHEGEPGSFALKLGHATERWLFETRLNLPLSIQEDLAWFDDDKVSPKEKIHGLNEILQERQISSAPLWWEMDFFEFRTKDLWEFFVEQCRRNYADDEVAFVFNSLADECRALDAAKRVLNTHKYNKDAYTEEEVTKALEIYAASYPLDFVDYQEPIGSQEPRGPYQRLRSFIAGELSDVGAVFSKKWFEFKILDELVGFFRYVDDGNRDSELSKKLASQLRGMMYGRLMSLGRMVEHYRWKFSFEEAALRGIQQATSAKKRGQMGGIASSRRKKENLLALLEELEALSDLYPRMGEQAIFDQAYSNACQKRGMPKSPRTIEDYGTVLRSDPEYRARYQKVFAKNT